MIRTLTRREIEERLQGLLAEVGGEPTEEPRWITPAELVRKVRPFIVYN